MTNKIIANNLSTSLTIPGVIYMKIKQIIVSSNNVFADNVFFIRLKK